MKPDHTPVKPATPPRLRLKLTTLADVRREAARLYREGRSGQRPIADVSRLANVLMVIGKLIETTDFEKRLEALEGETTHTNGE